MADGNEDEARSNEQTGSVTRPVAVFTGSGGLKVAVWKNKSEEGNRDYFSIKIERNYKGEDEKFHTTQYLRDSDLLRAQKLLEQADSWIEQERQNKRSSGTRER